MSLGPSDETWAVALREWLLADEKHHLVFYKYSETQFSLWNRDEMMDEEDSQRTILLHRLFDLVDIERVENQVHIPINYDIFNFKNVIAISNANKPKFVGEPAKFTAPR